MLPMDIDEVFEHLAAAEQNSLSPAEAAQVLGWPLARLRTRVHRGKLAAFHLPSAVRIPVSEIDRLLAAGDSDRHDPPAA